MLTVIPFFTLSFELSASTRFTLPFTVTRCETVTLPFTTYQPEYRASVSLVTTLYAPVYVLSPVYGSR